MSLQRAPVGELVLALALAREQFPPPARASGYHAPPAPAVARLLGVARARGAAAAEPARARARLVDFLARARAAADASDEGDEDDGGEEDEGAEGADGAGGDDGADGADSSGSDADAGAGAGARKRRRVYGRFHEQRGPQAPAPAVQPASAAEKRRRRVEASERALEFAGLGYGAPR